MSTQRPRERKCPTEREEAEAFVEFLAYEKLSGRISHYSHLPTNTPAVTKIDGKWKTNFSTIGRLKKEGVVPGVPDYIIVLSSGGGIAFVELKAMDGKPSKEQVEWINSINRCDNSEAKVCYGAKEAIEFVQFMVTSSDDNRQRKVRPGFDTQIQGDTV